MRVIIAIVLLFVSVWARAQEENTMISGSLMGMSDGEQEPLIGANVYWLGTTIGTTTDFEGRFELERVKDANQIVLSYVGYRSDTIEVNEMPFLEIVMDNSVDLQTVEVTYRTKSTQTSLLETIKVDNISERELQKAACCSLSESFETNASVDVTHTDAVSGRKQIEMLGLASPYIQMTRENMPFMEGMAASTGFDLTPGPWIESIQLSKGVGSVVNGHNGIAGQINTELRKPIDTDSWYINLFANQLGRVELNTHSGIALKNKDWSTAILLHGRMNGQNVDNNSDGFVDVPKNRHLIGMNRWEYHNEKGNHFQGGIKGTYATFDGGQIKTSSLENPWLSSSDLTKVDGFMKIGKVFLDMPWKTYGLQLYASSYSNDNTFGDVEYNGDQTELRANFIYQSILSNLFHQIKVGGTYEYRGGKEQFASIDWTKNESTASTYGEYVYDAKKNVSVLLGLRFDYHNQYGFFWNPRAVVRYQPWTNGALRVSGGKGWRSPSVLSDNMGLMASNRSWVFADNVVSNPFELKAEEAWNYGINFTQKFDVGQRGGVISADFYRTDFENQVVMDLDNYKNQVAVYNLDGKSFSHAAQIEIDYELLERLDLRMAYRFTDVQSTYGNQQLEKPFVAKHRGFANLAYETNNDWKFDWTINRIGMQRIPGSIADSFDERSPSFWLMNAQVSKTWPSSFEIYLGAENLANYKQDNPIISADNPRDPSFDAAMIWGPVAGRIIYTGLRYRIPRS